MQIKKPEKVFPGLFILTNPSYAGLVPLQQVPFLQSLFPASLQAFLHSLEHLPSLQPYLSHISLQVAVQVSPLLQQAFVGSWATAIPAVKITAAINIMNFFI
jgi:hypothetical protein